jgi:predicted MFS family arabinose efflux permease
MFEPDQSWLVSAFALSNAVRALFYVPQVLAVARSVDGARDIALSTWWMWTLNNALGAVYTGVVMGHTSLAVSFWASCFACLLTIALATRARRRLQGGAPRLSAQPAGGEI